MPTELTRPTVRVAMKGTDHESKITVIGFGPYTTVSEGGVKGATNVVSTPDILTHNVDEVVGHCKGVFCSIDSF